MLDYSPTQSCTAGERYEAAVPDTLDLADRMTLAVNALTNVWSPQQKWAHNLVVNLAHRPASLYTSHAIDAWLNVTPKFIEALLLCRLGSGSRQNLDVDRHVIDLQVELTGEDGLNYFPTDVMKECDDAWWRYDRVGHKSTYCETVAEARRLLALALLSQVDENPQWVAMGKKKTDRLLELTCEKEGFRFFWRPSFAPGDRVPPDADEPRVSTGGESEVLDAGQRTGPSNAQSGVAYDLGRIAYALAHMGHGAGLFYRVTGYEPALELSRGMARWALARLFHREDGVYEVPHFHAGTRTLISICEYAWAVGDREIFERVDACYRFAREMGDPLVGFYAEFLPGSKNYLERTGNTVEICEVSNMVFLALYLTRAGMGDYWDDVDRWVRNIYTEGQMTGTDFLERIPESYFRTDEFHKPHMITDNVAQRSVGSFFGWMRANDALMIEETDQGPKLSDFAIMHCCTANGARVLYLVWDSIVTRQADEVKVNLLLNRASKWLDVDSYLPVQGKVVLHIKDAPKVSVRIPQWCRPDDVKVTVGGQPRRVVPHGRFLKIQWLKPGDEVVLQMSVPQRSIARVIGEIPYKLEIRGANVVDIEPRGIGYPLYANQPAGKLVQKSRFIPEMGRIIW